MQAGKLNKRLTLERYAETKQANYGEIVETWTRAYELWGQVEPLSGSERFTAQQVIPTASLKVTFRWRHGIKERDRFKLKQRQGATRIFEINALMDMDERHRVGEAICTEVR